MVPHSGRVSERPDNGSVGNRPELGIDDGAVGRDKHPGGLRRNSKLGPGDAGTVPQEFHLGDLVSGQEGLCLRKAVLRTESDDVDPRCILSGKLLDPGGFPVACGSMWGPEPHQQWLLPIERCCERNILSGLHVGHIHDRKRIDRLLRRSGPDCGALRCCAGRTTCPGSDDRGEPEDGQGLAATSAGLVHWAPDGRKTAFGVRAPSCFNINQV